KQAFIVEPRPGGNGNVGLNAVAKGPSDGYTLLATLDYPLTINPFLYDRVPFDPTHDFKPISIVASFSQALVVHPSVPVHSLAEFVTYAKTRKDQPVIYDSGGGPGNPGHMTMEYFRLRAAFEGVHVPYNGNPDAIMGIASGQVQAGFLATAGVLPLVA